MLEKVKKYINDWQMLSKGDRVVAGVSGGPDSVALLHVLRELRGTLGIGLFAAHVNHGLRGDASDGDAAFVEALCTKWEIPLFQKGADIGSLSRAKHLSEEEAGRLVRYSFFREVVEEVNGNRIATAHHKNDQAETILHHMLRGAGMQGLAGIKPVSGGCLIRPLLDVSRAEIEDYLREHGLCYRVDATNADTSYTRNRIRGELIPVLARDYNPDIVDGLARMGSIIREEDDFMEQYCGGVYRECSSAGPDSVDLDLDKLLSCPAAVQKRLIRTALCQVRGSLEGVGYAHIEAIAGLAARSRTGSVAEVPGSGGGSSGFGVIAEKGYGVLRFRRAGERNIPVSFDLPLPVPGSVLLRGLGIRLTAERVDAKKGFAFSPECIYIDERAVKGGLRVRQRRNGDRFRPLGLNGTKKLKDFFIDRKIPREQRDRIPLLVDGDHIIWVVGLQMNGDYRITPSSGEILKISVQYTISHGG